MKDILARLGGNFDGVGISQPGNGLPPGTIVDRWGGDSGGIGDVTLDNPIAGTPLDPKRRARVRMQDVGVGGVGGVGGMEPSDGLSPDASGDWTPQLKRRDGSTVGEPSKVPITGTPRPNELDILNNPPQPYTNELDVLEGRASSVSAPAALPTSQPSGPSLLRQGESAMIPNTSDLLDDEGDETQLLKQLLSQDMSDTPSAERIRQLEEQRGRLLPQKVPLWRRLLGLGLTAAPVVAGGLIDGTVGVDGAAEGVDEAGQLQYARGMEREKILNAQIEAERQRQERQYERRLQLPVTIGNMMMLRDYRRAQLERQTAADKGRQDLGYRKLGLDAEGQQIPFDQLSLPEREKIELQDTMEQLNRARAELLVAQKNAQGDPNNPEYQLKLRRVQAMESFAQTRFLQYIRGSYGVGMDGNVLPGTYVDPNTNQPLGWQAPGNPTANVKNRGQVAGEVLQHFPSIRQNLEEVSDADLGMLSGHFNEWITGKWGNDNPALSRLRTSLNMASTAMMMSHVGASGGIEMMNHFKSMVNLGQSKANLFANLAEMEGWLNTYAAGGTPNAAAGEPNSLYPGGASAPVGTRQSNSQSVDVKVKPGGASRKLQKKGAQRIVVTPADMQGGN